MTPFVVINDVNDVVRSGTCESDKVGGQAREGETALPFAGYPGTHYYNGEKVVAYTPEQAANRATTPPPLGKRWSAVEMDWVDLESPPLDTLQGRLIARLATKRDTLLEGGFTWSDRIVQSDMAVSQTRLLGLFTTDLAGGIPAEGLGWKFANGWKTIYPGDGISIWAAFQAFMQSLFVAFKAHEDAVKAETDIEILRSYNVDGGWPT